MFNLFDIKEKKQRKKTRFIKVFSRIVLKIIGWKTAGAVPESKKYVMVGYPHTSNWDVPVGLLVFLSMGVRLHWVGKQSLFKKPLGWFIKKLGGIPVDRSKSQNFVQQVIDKFNEFDELVLTLSPEATRGKSAFWRSGFYYIAHGARVPIGLAFLDYKKKTGGFLGVVHPSGNIEKDLQIIKEHYRGVVGKKEQDMGEIKLAPPNDN